MTSPIKWRLFARGAGKAVAVFPRATVTLSPASAAGSFLVAKKEIADASKKAEQAVRSKSGLIAAE